MLARVSLPTKILISVLLLLTIAVSLQSYFLPRKGVDHNRILYSQYNNFEIFQDAHFHLIEGKNLYKEYPLENYDLFKYSPTFALFMGVFAYMPDMLGLILWNLLNVLVLIYAITLLPFDTRKKTFLLLAFITVELITSLQNTQSNALLAGLLIWAFCLMDKGKLWKAALLISITFYIKVFGLLGFALFIFYPKKGKAILYSSLSMLLLFLLPVPWTGFSGLLEQYTHWGNMLQNDHSASIGLSMMGWLETWFGLDQLKSILLVPGIIFLLLPLVRYRFYSQSWFRLTYLANLLIWMVIFNHKAESPTFIIAVLGVGIWYFINKKSWFHTTLLFLTLIFTSLASTDLFPAHIRNDLFAPYVIKAVPCIWVWLVLTYEMLFPKAMALKNA